MPVQETVVDQRPIDLAPVDTSVNIPESVRRAAAHAESFYAKPAEPEKAQEQQPPAQQQEQQPPAQQQEQQPPAQQQQERPPQTPAERTMADGSIDWEHRYLSMKGRYDASQRTIGSMQEQMQQLGDELVRTQTLLARTMPQEQPQHQAQDHKKFITPQDEENYGTDLIDLTRRAAREAVAPELEDLRNQNNELREQVITTSRNEMYAELAAAVPNWREINSSPQFKRWLSLRDVYSGGVRQQMLNAAHGAADAPRVIAFFKGFINEARATGQQAPAAQQAQDIDPPRQAALSLDRLAAPGRAKPASGNEMPAASADKPIYTRAQIQTFYADVRRGAYRGQETKKAEIEASIFAAQSDGRVR